MSKKQFLYGVFIAFLKENNAYHCFFEDAMDKMCLNSIIKVRDMLSNSIGDYMDYSSIIYRYIHWSRTKKGRNFYCNLHEKWRYLCYSKLSKYF